MRDETHNDKRRKRFLLGSLVALLVVVVLVRVFAGDSTGAGDDAALGTTPPGDDTTSVTGTGGAEVSNAHASFSIDGHTAEPISPGVSVPLDLELSNSHDVPMSVVDLRVAVGEISAPRADDARPCVVADFAVKQVPSGLAITVPAGTTSTLSSLGVPRASWPHVGMLNRSVNQDGCKGASLTLRYTASGTLVT